VLLNKLASENGSSSSNRIDAFVSMPGDDAPNDDTSDTENIVDEEMEVDDSDGVDSGGR
jgi:hypothetical protein